MSNARFCIIPARALGDKRLCLSDIMTLNAFGLHGDKEGWCFPSHEEIARLIGSHIQTVRKSTRNLAECGYLQIKPRKRKDGSTTSNGYRIIFDAPDEMPQGEGEISQAEVAPIIPATKPCDTPLSESAHPSAPIDSGSCAPEAQGAEPGRLRASNLTPQLTPHQTIPGKPGKEYPVEFEAIWKQWPEARRCEKKNAFDEYRRAIRKVKPEHLLAAVKKYIDSEEVKKGYAPYPAKWLKGERWEDYGLETVVSKSTVTLDDLGGDTPDHQLMLAMLLSIKEKCPEPEFRAWFTGLKLVAIGQDKLTVSVPGRFKRDWLQSNRGPLLLDEARRQWQWVTSVDLTIAQSTH